MKRQEKQEVVSQLKLDFTNSQAAFLVGIKGLNVAQIQTLRRTLRQQGGTMRLAKNTLMEIASRDIPGVKDLAPFFKEQVAVVFASKEAPALAKILSESAKEHEALRLVAGCLEAQIIDKMGIDMLASLPPREVLLAQVCGTLKAPITSYVSILNQLIVRLLYVLKKIEENKSN